MKTDYSDVLTDDESLTKFLAAIEKFNREFCECIIEGLDFTLRIEVHGDKGKMNHARVYCESFRRPRAGAGPSKGH